MKLVSLKIDSFGGISNTQIPFDPEFTVIQGPNEAGKSTIFNILRNLLLTDVSLSKPVFKKSMHKFLPLTGGDTVGGELRFLHEGNMYTLRKQWGGEPAVLLSLPAGERITDEKEVKLRLKRMLPSGEGTVRDIFLTHQSSLGNTLDRLSDDDEIRFSFSDVLKKAVLETGGISLAKFHDRLADLYTSYFKRWDRVRQFPEGGRGIRNPYKTGLGYILSSYYDVENLKFRLEEAQKKENEYEECEKEHEEISLRLTEIEGFLQDRADLYRQAREGVTIMGELTQLTGRAELLKTDQERWPVAEVELRQFKKEQAEFAAALSAIKKEREKADHIEKHRVFKEKYERALKKRRNLQEKQKKLAELKQVDEDVLKEMRSLAAEMNQLKGVLSSQILNVSIEAKKETVFSFSGGEGAADQKISLAAGESRRVTAPGRIRLEAAGWKMDITSGDEKAQKAEQEYVTKKKREEEILSETGAEDLSGLELLSGEYEKAAEGVRSSMENLESELEGVTFEELETEIADGGLKEKTRPRDEIIEEDIRLEKDAEALAEKTSRIEKELEDFAEKYGDKETLFKSMIAAHTRKQELEDALPGAETLPEGMGDYSAFISMYEEKQKERDLLKDSHSEIKSRKKGLETGLPDESTVEIKARLEDAREIYGRNVRKGEALVKIMEIGERISSREENIADTPFQELFTRYLREMTADKYSTAVMAETLPTEIGEKEGHTIPHDYLSAGTKDTFSLALKLAMVKTFLQGKEGFFVLDDPLVDMDPKRQKDAAAAIAGSAGDIQVVLFTCHPSHAALFSGAEILQLKE